jgi:hypothetical protein
LPTRIDQIAALQEREERIRRNGYWSGEQTADDERWAWYQGFSYGGQTCSQQGPSSELARSADCPFNP